MQQFLRSRRFAIGLLFVLIVSGGLQLASYDFSLPFLDTDDESNYYVAGLERRGLFDNRGYFDGVPPGYIAVQTVLQPPLELSGINDIASTTRALRLLSLATNLLTLTLIALTARRMAGDLAGVVAGSAWGIAPLVIENGVYALPDPFVYVFSALALWLAVEALVVPSRRMWCVWSVVAALGAVLMKYPALPALLPGGLVALWTLREDRKRGLRLLAMQAAIVAAVGLWLVFIYGVNFSSVEREGAIVRNEGLSNLMNISRVLNNIYYGIVPVQPALWLVICGLGVAAYFATKKRIHLGSAGLCVVILLTIPWLISSFNEVIPEKIRYVLPATAAACVLLGAAVEQIVRVLPSRLTLPLSGIALALVVAPQVQADLKLVADRRLPDTRVELRQWFDANLEPGTVIVDGDNDKTFNPIYGGIPHRTWVDWQTASITDYSLDEWIERGLSYAVIPRWQLGRLEKNEAHRPYLTSMLHLRDIFVPPAARGPQMSIYRLWRMDVERTAEFSDGIQLIGYDQSADEIQPGEPLTLRFYWQATQTPVDNYSLFMHFVPLESYDVIAQVDGSPAVPERPTLTWDDASETLISPAYTLTIPDAIEPGAYRVFIGLYNYTTGKRLLVNGDEAALLLTQVSIPAN